MANRRRGVTITAFYRAEYLVKQYCQQSLQDKESYDSDSASNRAFL
jgi:hypothetical protein